MKKDTAETKPEIKEENVGKHNLAQADPKEAEAEITKSTKLIKELEGKLKT